MLLALTIGAGIPIAAPAQEANKYKVEAAFIYQFTNYIEWPAGDLGPEDQTFVITLLGDTPLFEELKNLEAQKKFKGRKLEVRRASPSGPLAKSHIIIIAESQSERLESVLRKVDGSSTLVITDASGLGKKGAMINFLSEEGRIRFEINRRSIQKQRFQMGSQLLNLARLIE